MENAAFFYVCRKQKIPFASFKAISNKVEPRNHENWRIAEAVESVNETLTEMLRSFRFKV
jgi:nucleoside phosphorylase